MSRVVRAVLILAAVVAAGIGGHWLGRHGLRLPMFAQEDARATPRAPSGPVIYYRHPDGKPVYSIEAKTTLDGRPYRPVYASEDITFDPKPATASTETGGTPSEKKILYYRNPMGLPDVSPVPKKDSMGMDYIPVYEGEDDDSGGIKISPGRIQRIGVASEPVSRRKIVQKLRAPGTIQLDERNIAVISLRAEAFIDKVEDVTTGTEVKKGQPLVRIYSPAIASAASEYLSTLNLKGDAAALRGPRQRLLNFALPAEFLAEIERTRQVPLTFTWTALRDGIVLERNVVEGMRVVPGDVLFRIADHSKVWALVDVPEMHIAHLAVGQKVAVRARSYADKTFEGRIALVYPHLNPATRTVRVRIELPNRGLLLLPDMYAEAEIETGSGETVLAVPESALIDSGDSQFVILDKGKGRFEPRPVKPGTRGSGFVEIREGVAEGDVVVTSATFLIDAESNLKAALKSLTGAGAPQ
jgi:membrane fusion protein, copper/silver efflux system